MRVALLGSDSTHTEAFASRIQQRDGVTVASLYGEDPLLTQRKATALGVTRVETSVEDALVEADLAMVIGRFGESHLTPASAALAAGIPTFVDKPFTTLLADAQALVALGARYGTPLCSASALRFADEVQRLAARLREEEWSEVDVTVPLECTDLGDDPRFRSVFFYGIHGVEVLLELVGHALVAVGIERGADGVVVRLTLADGHRATLRLLRGIEEAYAVRAVTATGETAFDIALDGAYYDRLLDRLLDGFMQGRTPVAVESTLAAIAILEAVEQGHPWTPQ